MLHPSPASAEWRTRATRPCASSERDGAHLEPFAQRGIPVRVSSLWEYRHLWL